MERPNQTVYDRDKVKYLTTLVHDEWLEMVIAGHEEPYKEWCNFAAWLIVQCAIPEQRDGNVA